MSNGKRSSSTTASGSGSAHLSTDISVQLQRDSGAVLLLQEVPSYILFGSHKCLLPKKAKVVPVFPGAVSPTLKLCRF